MKKTTQLLIGTLCVITSTSLFAHDYKGYKGEVLPALTPVTVANFNGGFEFTLEALYLQPTTTNLRFLTLNNSSPAPVNLTDVSKVRYDIEPEYDWGYLIGIGYVFPNTGNDVQLSWMHFDNNSSSSRNAEGPIDAVVFNPGSESSVTLDADQFLNAHGETENTFNAIDLTFGQSINIGPHLQTRLFTGLRYMKLKNEVETSYEITEASDEVGSIFIRSYDGQMTSDFNGLGPLFGVKADYNFGWGFGITGSFDAALLVGNLTFDVASQDALSSGSILLETVSDREFDETSIISPGFDARLGVNYKYQMNNGAMFGLEIGYQVTKYLDVVEQLEATSVFSTVDPLETDVTNFGLNGLYLSLNVRI